MPELHEVTLSAPRRQGRFLVQEGRFPSPAAVGPLPAACAEARFQLLLPPDAGPRPPVCLFLASSGDHGYGLRRFLARDVVSQGVGALLLENPYYGSRRPPGPAGRGAALGGGSAAHVPGHGGGGRRAPGLAAGARPPEGGQSPATAWVAAWRPTPRASSRCPRPSSPWRWRTRRLPSSRRGCCPPCPTGRPWGARAEAWTRRVIGWPSCWRGSLHHPGRSAFQSPPRHPAGRAPGWLRARSVHPAAAAALARRRAALPARRPRQRLAHRARASSPAPSSMPSPASSRSSCPRKSPGTVLPEQRSWKRKRPGLPRRPSLWWV